MKRVQRIAWVLRGRKSSRDSARDLCQGDLPREPLGTGGGIGDKKAPNYERTKKGGEQRPKEIKTFVSERKIPVRRWQALKMEGQHERVPNGAISCYRRKWKTRGWPNMGSSNLGNLKGSARQ